MDAKEARRRTEENRANLEARLLTEEAKYQQEVKQAESQVLPLARQEISNTLIKYRDPHDHCFLMFYSCYYKTGGLLFKSVECCYPIHLVGFKRALELLRPLISEGYKVTLKNFGGIKHGPEAEEKSFIQISW